MENPYTVGDVMNARQNGHGCCNRYADNMGCDCVEHAADYHPAVHGNGIPQQAAMRAVILGNGTNTHEFLVRELIKAVGDDPDRAGLKETPARVVRSWAELFCGYGADVKSLFTTFEEEVSDSMVAVKDIEFWSTCEHHMLPFVGVAHVGYIPGRVLDMHPDLNRPSKFRVLGLSKTARLVDAFARRLQLQERITKQVVDALVEHLEPVGAGCVIEAKHLCTGCRGVRRPGAVMVTSEVRGAFRESGAARAEFFQLVYGR